VSIFFPVVASTILGVIGQLALKIGMTKIGAVSLAGGGSRNIISLVWSIGTNLYVIGGLLTYGAGVFFWLIALSRASLSYTYPFASLSYVLVILVSFFVLREKINLLRLAGVLVICLGVMVVAIS
jgi:drug/metabolite transporter (DMT)-like permease